jgi:hypothetical protein
MNKKFEEWASNWYQGIEGGNPDALLWICGMEYSRDYKKKTTLAELISSLQLTEKTTFPHPNGNHYPCIHSVEERSNMDKGAYDQKVAKLAVSILEPEMDRSEFVARYMCSPPYSDESNNAGIFKLNLYPLPLTGHDPDKWDCECWEFTGFRHRKQYEAWCMNNRFPYLQKLLERHRPKALVCTGKSIRLEFRLAFAPLDSPLDVEPEYLPYQVNNTTRYCEYFKALNNETTVYITPFLSWRMGVEEIQELAKTIRKHSQIG